MKKQLVIIALMMSVAPSVFAQEAVQRHLFSNASMMLSPITKGKLPLAQQAVNYPNQTYGYSGQYTGSSWQIQTPTSTAQPWWMTWISWLFESPYRTSDQKQPTGLGSGRGMFGPKNQ